MPDKEWYKSVTTWGGILMVLAFVLSQLGFNITSEEQKQLSELLTSVATAIGGILGLVMVMIGRNKAGQEIKKLRLLKGVFDPSRKGGFPDSFISWTEQLFGTTANSVISGIAFMTTEPGRRIIASIIDGFKSPQGKKFLEQLEKLKTEEKPGA